MSRRVVLIRAINVGGARLPMSELRDIATELGATEVSTYIASGNLVLTPPKDPAAFDRELESVIEARYGFFREVISRSADDLRDALDRYPFEVIDDKRSFIYFLTADPLPDRLISFAEKDFGDDLAQVIGTDLHVRYCVGAGTTKLTAPVIARGLGIQGTGRNLRTVRTLVDLAEKY